MADQTQLQILNQGVSAWNDWRKKNVMEKIDLSGVELKKAHLRGINLAYSNLSGAELPEANLIEAILQKANLSGANLQGANLAEAYLGEATLNKANLSQANLSGADFWEADLSEANLSEAWLTQTDLVNTTVDKADISKAKVYGVNVWGLKGDFENQKELIITPEDASVITVDNIKVAQFVYLILSNKEIRDVLDTLTTKTVLILGRFTPERKKILDALRVKLREENFLPILFDFERSDDRDYIETIKTLAGLCYFVIADVTDPSSIPLELQATVPEFQIPFVTIIEKGRDKENRPFAMMQNLQTKYPAWMLPTKTYDSLDHLMERLKEGIIEPVKKVHAELRIIKAQKQSLDSL